MSACPCGCGRNLGHVRQSVARRWVEIQCTMPLLERCQALLLAAGKDGEENRLALERALVGSRELADAWLSEAHGETTFIPASELKRRMNDWQSMALVVMKSMKAIDPVFTQQWWATKPWSKQPTLLPGRTYSS
jgi:hypothetical protein